MNAYWISSAYRLPLILSPEVQAQKASKIYKK
jgi:hypothetical protein